MRPTALMFALSMFLAACVYDNPSNDKSPVGGWKGNGLYACFAADGRLAMGDHVGELSTPAGTWTQDGKLTFPSDPNDHGTWSINSDGNLVLAAPTSCTTGCGPFLLTPDNSLPCFK